MKYRADGYVAIHRPDHPAATSDGYVLYHRRVMEKHLRRYLHPEEVVHHIDGNPRNNRLRNLQLLESHSAHALLHWLQLSPERQAKKLRALHAAARSPASRAKMSLALLGNQHRKGVPHTAETKARIAKTLTGRKRGPYSAAHRAKIAEANKGRSLRGSGWKHSEEAKRKMSEAAKRRSELRRANRAANPPGAASPSGSGSGGGP